VPAERGKHGFNIDHVVIGPSGVAIVEVKTRRKGNSRPGYKDHEVSFDGVRLDWPWGYDQRCIQQALNEADWLAKWIMARTGLKLPVQAVLTIPGWWVNERATRPLRVVNPSFLPDVIRQLADTPLSPQKVELIVRQLDVVCRDVEE
jgi:hypothetical protein